MYHELFEAKFNEVQHEYRQANEGRAYRTRPTLRGLFHRLTGK